MGDSRSPPSASKGPRTRPADARALVPRVVDPATTGSASVVRLPTRFPSEYRVRSDNGDSFRSLALSSMVLTGESRCRSVEVATSAETLLALGGGGAGLVPIEGGGAVAVHKKRRVVAARGHRRKETSGREEVDGQELGSGSDVDEGATTASSIRSDEVAEKTKKRPRRIRKYRKATHTIRKEEKEALQKELAALSEKMLKLQRRALSLTAESEDDESAEDKTTSRNVLCHLLRRQQLEFATIRKLVTESTASVIRVGSPIEEKIHMKKDLHSRRELLARIKDSKLRDGLSFLHSRLPEVDLGSPMDEDFRFESPEGDFYACHFTIIQFESMRNARQVFDQLIYYLCNVEISISEKVGHLTIREDDDVAADGIAQNKIVSTTVHGIKMESNAVVFSRFYDTASPGDRDGEYGVIVTDFVDLDDRHPYRPTERIRKDVSNVMEVRPHWRTRPDGQREEVVVLVRWAHSHLRYPEFAVPRAAWLDLRDSMDIWSKNMHKVIMESMISSSSTSSTGVTTLSIAHPPLFLRPWAS